MSRLIIAPVLGLVARQSFRTIEESHDFSCQHDAAGPVAL